ncbi:MAG: hypothetical protein Q4C54_06525 [Clostridia bacterium]|nr:hypothetical protein [Clostridia bacterium]
MFGGDAAKISKIQMFNDFGFIGKTVALTSQGGRTEDMKLLSVDFEEVIGNDAFIGEHDDDSSALYEYLHDHKLLCIIFEEQKMTNQSTKADLRENIFRGFKVIDLDDATIYEEAEKTWNDIRHTILVDGLCSTPMYDRNGRLLINPNGSVKEQINLPKSRDHIIFLRGTGTDSNDKILVDGVRIYRQNYWIKGKFIADTLRSKDYL